MGRDRRARPTLPPSFSTFISPIANFSLAISSGKATTHLKFSYYYLQKSCFSGKIFLKTDTQVSVLENLSHFWKKLFVP